MKIKVACSKSKNESEAVNEIKNQFSDIKAKLIVFFNSSIYDAKIIAEEINNAFEGTDTIGCTTAGEIVSGEMLKESLVAMALTNEVVEDVKIEIIENLSRNINVNESVNSFEDYYGSLKELDFEKYFGLILVDGLSGAEEKLMDQIGTSTNINIIGGSAGDDLNFKSTYVMANGKVYNDAALLAIIKAGVKFDLIKTQSFCSTGKELIATKVNEANREVIEFNSKPASEAYAESIGADIENASDYFMKHPVGLMIGDEPYVRSPQQIIGSTIKFYCNILEGMKLDVLESQDIVNDTKKAIDEKVTEMGEISGIINFNCILRTLELIDKNQTNEYGEIFKDIPTVGFSTYGEEYIGHINQTATMLVFK
ncbi:MAG: FIST N-terminal domain-containing protein [Ignavibacteria bacterium]|jgi:hypothetical protein